MIIQNLNKKPVGGCLGTPADRHWQKKGNEYEILHRIFYQRNGAFGL